MKRRRSIGWTTVIAGGALIASSLTAAGITELAEPERLVTSGPYAVSRNPMYVGWSLLHLGIGMIAGSGWIIATLPFVGAAIHRDVVGEERRLTTRFGDEYKHYAARVGRYFPKR
ncbi:isoprenylcysteine carboxylmethyltransferase family protein [Kribbella sp. NPDC023972]|uniref:methyltransferase family protein n=1 Tax=Kribbella sp. NPDC023972 TaxID=3154795 RepID=UPI00340A1356